MIPILMFFYIKIVNVICEREKKEFLLYNFQENDSHHIRSSGDPSGRKSFTNNTMNTMNTVDTDIHDENIHNNVFYIGKQNKNNLNNDIEINHENILKGDLIIGNNIKSNNISELNTKSNNTQNTTRKSLIGLNSETTKRNNEYIMSRDGYSNRSIDIDKSDETEKNSNEKNKTDEQPNTNMVNLIYYNFLYKIY